MPPFEIKRVEMSEKSYTDFFLKRLSPDAPKQKKGVRFVEQIRVDLNLVSGPAAAAAFDSFQPNFNQI